ncbi:MAG: molybdate ABC transporter substrate-binding protein [Solirubrobacteraceae bacterium]
MRRLFCALTVAILLVAGCGGSSGDKPELKVSAAASLKKAATAYAAEFPGADVKLSFGGSDELAAQIRAGARPDVFAAANAKLPDALYKEGLVEKPVGFARNRLVIAVPAKGAKVETLDDLAKPGTKLAIGSPSVPIGSYTRTVLSGLPAAQRQAILANVRSQEPDVSGVVGKVAEGAVDAGFVYVSDVQGAGGRLRAIALPDSLQPEVLYEAAVVKGTKHPDQARAFVAGLRSGAGRRELEAAGFLAP